MTRLIWSNFNNVGHDSPGKNTHLELELIASAERDD